MHKLFIFGLDKAGKTALKTLIRVGAPPKATRPTLSFDISNMIVKDLKFTVWDAPGQKLLRKDWKKGFTNASIMMFVMDISETSRFEEAKKEFDSVVNNEETKGVPLIICYHKMDIDGAKLNLEKAKETLDLNTIKGRSISSFETSIFYPKVAEEIKDKLAIIIALNQRF